MAVRLKVYRYDRNKNYIDEFESQRDAETKINVCRKRLLKCLETGGMYDDSYYFSYVKTSKFEFVEKFRQVKDEEVNAFIMGKLSECTKPNIAQIAKDTVKEFNLSLKYDAFRKRVARVRKNMNFDASKGVADVISDANLNPNEVKHLWIKEKSYSAHVYNPEFQLPEFDPDLIDWDKILEQIDLPETKPPKKERGLTGIFDRLVFTDAHVGMETNKDDLSQYGGKWDEEELMIRCENMIDRTLQTRNSNILIIDDLGDLADGWDEKTVRREHRLPQNMNNQDAFDIALGFKLRLITELAKHYNRVIVNNISEDNHGGPFTYVINSALKKCTDIMCKNVEMTNHRRFINHYRIFDNVFIISHGKDSKNLKFGFKPKLDDRQMEKIDNYIDHHYLLQKGVRIEFSKGDSHQLLFDNSSSDRFDYFNYMAFSPSSNWVQTNFKIGKSGFTNFNYEGTNDYTIRHVFFKWNKNG